MIDGELDAAGNTGNDPNDDIVIDEDIGLPAGVLELKLTGGNATAETLDTLGDGGIVIKLLSD